MDCPWIPPTTRVPQDHSCPPRGGLVQGWESLCWGVGDSLNCKIKLHSNFQVPLIENKSIFQLLKSLQWKLQKKQSMLFDRYWSHRRYEMSILCLLKMLIHIQYQISIPCFLKDIDRIFKIFKTLLDGSSGLFGLRFPQDLQNCGFPQFWDFPT